MRQLRLQLGFVLTCCLLIACGGSETGKGSPILPPEGPPGNPGTPTLPTNTRSFHMGFTPWLYDATQEASDWTWNKINQHGDMISQHVEEGVPWIEMFSPLPQFPPSFLAEIQNRKNHTGPGKRVLLSIGPLNMLRSGLADYRGAQPNMPLPAPWNSYPLNHPNVKAAYLNYAREMVQFFDPDYLIIGIEVNLLIRNVGTTAWQQYVELHRDTYTQLKAEFPQLPISVSLDAIPYFPEYSDADAPMYDAQLQAIADLRDYVDFFSFSIHPFNSGLFAEYFPPTYFGKLFSLTNKPIAISETSYTAQHWEATYPGVGTLSWNGTPEKQEAYMQLLLEAAKQYDLKFVVWFCVRDYDQLWEGLLNESLLALSWRDTGLYDENGVARPALSLWTDALAQDFMLSN